MRLPNGYGGITKLKGKRRKPYRVRVTTGFHFDKYKDRLVQDYSILGYAATKAEALEMLASHNLNPVDAIGLKITFEQVFKKWYAEHSQTIADSSKRSYTAAYDAVAPLHDRVFKDLKLVDLQHAIDNCGKNYPTMKKIKVIIKLMYEYAMKNDWCQKDYSEFIDLAKYKDRNPDKKERGRFTKEEIDEFWDNSNDLKYQLVLMLIYSGVRVGELLELKKEDVHLDQQYFEVKKSKTSNGLRSVPIATKVLPFYEKMMRQKGEYLVDIPYHIYLDKYFKPIAQEYQTPHWTRHTCASMMADAGIEPSIQKMILGHAGAMSLTERVYTHIDIKRLVEAIDKI